MNESPAKIITTLSDQHKHDLVELYKNEFWCNDREPSDVEEMPNKQPKVVRYAPDIWVGPHAVEP